MFLRPYSMLTWNKLLSQRREEINSHRDGNIIIRDCIGASKFRESDLQWREQVSPRIFAQDRSVVVPGPREVFLRTSGILGAFKEVSIARRVDEVPSKAQ